MASPLAAASAYANIARLAADPSHALANAAGAGGNSEASFTSVLKDAIGAVNETGKKSDTQTPRHGQRQIQHGRRGHRGGGDRGRHRCRGRGARQVIRPTKKS